MTTDLDSESGVTGESSAAAYETRHDGDDGPLSVAVVEAVATATETDPLEIAPLHRTVDPDALDHLFEPADEDGKASGWLRFSFAGCRVAVRSDGHIGVEPLDRRPDAPAP